MKRLKYKPDIPAAEYGKPAFFHRIYIPATDKYFAAVRRVQRSYHIQQRAFARPGFPDNCHILTLRHGKADIFQSTHRGHAAAKGFGN